MRDYGKVHTSIWASETLSGLDSDAMLFAIYLLTSQHSNMLGAFRLPDAYACEDLGWDVERLRNGFETLSRVGYIDYDARSKWVWVVKFLDWNRPENPNQWKAIAKLAASVPENVPFKKRLIERVSEPFRNSPVPVPVPVPTPDPAQAGDGEKPAKPAKAPKGHKHPIPADFAVSDRVRKWAEGKGYDRLPEHFENFTGVAKAKAYEYADWDEALMTAIRKDWAGLRVAGTPRKRVQL